MSNEKPGLHLGMIWDSRDMNFRNHRSLFKLVFNPFLRVVGLEFCSWIYDYETPQTMKYRLRRIAPRRNLLENLKDSWVYEYDKEHMLTFKYRRFI